MTPQGAAPLSRDALLARLPERARYVEARAMTLGDRCEARGGSGPEDPLLLVETAGGGLGVLVGRLEPGLLAHASSDRRIRSLLVEPEHLAAAGPMPGWRIERALLFELPLPEAEAMPAEEPGVRMLSKEDLESLSHLPESLREEILRVFPSAHVAAAFEEGRAVSLAYSVETESLWDVSIDTLEEFRGRGLAARTTRWLIGHMARHGKRPIWGALQSNAPSLALARRLGFHPSDEIFVCERAGP